MSIGDFLGGLLTLLYEGYVIYGIKTSSEKSGWLPYNTVPFDRYAIESGIDMDALAERLKRHYQQYSPEIIRDIESKIAGYAVDDEAKATLSEALAAHTHGLYRCSCRVLLPEIERVLRREWIGTEAIRPLGIKAIRNQMKEHGFEEFFLDRTAVVLFDEIFNHLFERFEDIDGTQNDRTPNRHGATHGWAVYSTEQHSLNTIICADYVFRLVTDFKEKERKDKLAKSAPATRTATLPSRRRESAGRR